MHFSTYQRRFGTVAQIYFYRFCGVVPTRKQITPICWYGGGAFSMAHSSSATWQSGHGLSVNKTSRSLAWGISIEIQGATTCTYQPLSTLPLCYTDSCSSFLLGAQIVWHITSATMLQSQTHKTALEGWRSGVRMLGEFQVVWWQLWPPHVVNDFQIRLYCLSLL